jgi:hypothetical protein
VRNALRLQTSVLLVVIAIPAIARGQAAWEYTPYQARVWLALQPTPQLPGSLIATTGESISSRATSVWKGVLQIDLTAPPSALRLELPRNLDSISAEAIAAVASRADLDLDKLFLAFVRYRDGAIDVSLRELDCRSRQIGPIVERSCAGVGELPTAVWDAIADSFTPLARIEQVEDHAMQLRLRAGGMITDPTSPAVVEPGMVLRPVVRRNDRSGQPAKGGIQPIDWTFLTVDERAGAVLACTLSSGYRTSVPPRGGVRLERLALLVRPRHEATRLVLRSRSEPTKPLVGYEIHRGAGSDEQSQILGLTDASGSIVLPLGDAELETLVVRNGRQLLARLPLIPGQQDTMTARIVDDDGRLIAEGLIGALNSRVLDLVARREILASQVRARTKEGKLADARRLLDDFRRLESRTDLSRDLDRYRRQATSTDKLTQSRIDRLFVDAQRMLRSKPLSDELLADLTREVSAAGTGGE